MEKLGVVGERGVGHIVVDADGEVILGHRLGEVVEDRLDHGGSEFLGGEAVAAADEAGHGGDFAGGEAFGQRGQDLLVERLAEGAGLLGAVEHGDGAHVAGSAARKCSTEKGR